MVLCIIVGCSSKSGKHKGLGFFRIPSVITTETEEVEESSIERRNRWISAISRDDMHYKDILQNERVCSKHFVHGRPAESWNKFNVDWVPTLNLGKKDYKEKDHTASAQRAERSKARRRKAEIQKELEVAKKLKLLNEPGEQLVDIDFTNDSCEASGSLENETARIESDLEELQLEGKGNSSTQTELSLLTMKDIATQTDPPKPIPKGDETYAENATQTEEFEYQFYTSSYIAPDKDFFDTAEKVRFYTGLPSMEILMVALQHVEPHITRRTLSLSIFQEFVIVLMKMRLNVPCQDLAYRFNVSLSTISRIFASWLVVMDIRLTPLISWPTRDQLWKTMPMCYQYSFGNKVTVIIDCFEVFIEKASNVLARAQTFSSYKHHNTVKVLIGITPQGTISFVSEAWGGRTSDKFLTENCGFLKNLLPGDMVMADRGFTITESVAMTHAKLVIPAFTKGKHQLDPVDVESTRGIANVRIHVERVIGLLRNKYTILQSTISTEYLTSSNRTKVPTIDRIIRVCSALVNLCPPIVPFD